VVDAHWSRFVATDFEQSQTGHGNLLASGFRNLKAQPNMTLPGEVIDLGGLHFAENPTQRGRIAQVSVVEKKSLPIDRRIVAQMLDALPEQFARAADDSVNLVTLREEEVREIRAILPGHAGNEGDAFFAHMPVSSLL
jgi:hypothetical protein